MDSITLIDASVPYCYPTPLLSIVMDGCIEKGRDVTGGGAKYNHTGINACGMISSLGLMRSQPLTLNTGGRQVLYFANGVGAAGSLSKLPTSFFIQIIP